MTRRAACLLIAPALVALLSLPISVGAQTASTAAAGPRFDILEFIVEGDSLLGADAIERAVYPFLGPDKGVADAEAARKALEKAYQDAGYLSVAVLLPPQQVQGGEIRLQVLPAPVAQLRVTGAEWFLPSDIRAAVPSLQPGQVPNFPRMQAELGLLAAQTADRQITPILAAGSEPGTLAVELKVQDQAPVHGSLELNNKQSLNTEAGRVEASLSYDNLWQARHSVGLNWFYSPKRPAEANIWTLSYHLPTESWLGDPGDRLYLIATHSDSDTPTPLGGATVSRGDTLRLRWRDQLSAPQGTDHALSWGLSWRDLRDGNRDVAGITTEPPSLRYASFQLGYEISFQGTQRGRLTRLGAEFTTSLPGTARRRVDCFGREVEQFACKRSGAEPRFHHLQLNASHREPLGAWQLDLRMQGQLANAPLVPAEQVVFGGTDSVRGYYEGEQAGDLGGTARAELSRPNLLPLWGGALALFGFGEAAWVNRLETLPGEVGSARLASIGLGLRLGTPSGLQASLDFARMLAQTERTSANGAEPVSGGGSGRKQRWNFSLSQRF
jgi:hemolysin activation/secretion protein